MTNTPHRVKATKANGRVVAASLIVGGAVGFLSLSAYAAQAASAPAAQTPPQLAITQAAKPAESADILQTPKVQAFESAPSLRGSVLDAPLDKARAPEAQEQGAAPASAVSTSALSKLQGEDVPWTLASDLRPWPLAYAELIPLNTLSFSLPTEKEARIMLPGYVADTVDRARFTASRYVTDNIGSAAQIRGRQLETFNLWAQNTSKQKLNLPKDPWAAYQFNKEALATLKAFKEKVLSQTEPTIQRMAQDINASVEKITPVMNVMATYEQKMQWYNVLVQLKEGVGLYQARVSEADRQILDAIAAFERDNPPVARPAGSPPPRPDADGVKPATGAVTPAVGMTPDTPREAAEPPARKQEQSSQTGGLIVLLGMGTVVIGLFMKLRKRISKKGAKAKSSAS
ncbi:hypothetical protein WJ97_10925 [Burkholderia ubonensis]|uniref:hypothetical protein n=1 Tax=Burkholderia ubonensis TaxID=101571 RepID=UPI000770C8AE|nr:hypothetical protein [Burkholderia ubonensis]KVP96395.1 hypothetical protein WJ97_10925 [Burkholderia ubonensis]